MTWLILETSCPWPHTQSVLLRVAPLPGMMARGSCVLEQGSEPVSPTAQMHHVLFTRPWVSALWSSFLLLAAENTHVNPPRDSLFSAIWSFMLGFRCTELDETHPRVISRPSWPPPPPNPFAESSTPSDCIWRRGRQGSRRCGVRVRRRQDVGGSFAEGGHRSAREPVVSDLPCPELWGNAPAVAVPPQVAFGYTGRSRISSCTR